VKSLFGKYELKNDRISDKIIAIIEQAVLNGEIKQGEKLPTEEKIAGEFKVSKVVVREALRDLETKGLIKKKRGKYGGNFVSIPDLKIVGGSLINCFLFGSLSANQIIEFRQTFEPVLARRAAEIRTEMDLVALRANIDDCENDIAQGRISTTNPINFHILIAKISHNDLITAIFESLEVIFNNIAKNWDVTEEMARLDLNYSYKIYDSILNHKGDKAERLMYQHFEETKIFAGLRSEGKV